jgi:hypothetical protein
MLNQNLSRNTIEWDLDPSAQTNIKTEIRNLREMADGLQVWIFAPQIFPELSKWMSINFPCEARNKITPFASTLCKYLQTHPQKQIPCRWLHLCAILHLVMYMHAADYSVLLILTMRTLVYLHCLSIVPDFATIWCLIKLSTVFYNQRGECWHKVGTMVNYQHQVR